MGNDYHDHDIRPAARRIGMACDMIPRYRSPLSITCCSKLVVSKCAVYFENFKTAHVRVTIESLLTLLLQSRPTADPRRICRKVNGKEVVTNVDWTP